jgi:hypothetical protein
VPIDILLRWPPCLRAFAWPVSRALNGDSWTHKYQGSIANDASAAILTYIILPSYTNFTMAQNQGFNYDFTDEVCQPGPAKDDIDIDCAKPQDAARLCQAPPANLPQYHFYLCCWITGQVVCSSLVQGLEFSEHLRSRHGVGGPDKALHMCCWNGCFAEMKKESLIRHVNEKHLEIKYGCSDCPEQFTRDYTLRNHMSKKHSVS